MKLNKRFFVLAALIAAFALLIAGCGDGNGNGNEGDEDEETAVTKIIKLGVPKGEDSGWRFAPQGWDVSNHTDIEEFKASHYLIVESKGGGKGGAGNDQNNFEYLIVGASFSGDDPNRTIRLNTGWSLIMDHDGTEAVYFVFDISKLELDFTKFSSNSLEIWLGNWNSNGILLGAYEGYLVHGTIHRPDDAFSYQNLSGNKRDTGDGTTNDNDSSSKTGINFGYITKNPGIDFSTAVAATAVVKSEE